MIVDDHKIFTDLLTFALTTQPDMDCVGTATTPSQARLLATDSDPDVVLMDIQLGAGQSDGIQLTPQIAAIRPGTQIVILTALKDHSLAIRAARAGAAGFLQKNGSLRTVLETVRAVHGGIFLFDDDVVRELVASTPPVPAGRPRMTRQQLHLLGLMAVPVSVDVIADRLRLSPGECQAQIDSIEHQLGARTRLEAVVTATSWGLIGGPMEAGQFGSGDDPARDREALDGAD